MQSWRFLTSGIDAFPRADKLREKESIVATS